MIDNPDATPLQKFLEKWNLCRASYYEYRKQGRAPRDFMVGGKVFISKQAEAEWIEARERARQSAG